MSRRGGSGVGRAGPLAIAAMFAVLVGVAFFIDLEEAIWSGHQLAGNWDVIWFYTLQHLRFTITAVTAGTIVSLPLAYLAVRFPGSYPAVLTITNVIYAIPSLALFIILSPAFGFTSDNPVIITMTLYTLVILVRNTVEAIRAVPTATVGAADGMGYRPLHRFVAVELPLAIPGIIAGLRLATVSTVSLISVAALVGRGALGRMLADGRRRGIVVELWASVIAIVSLAIVLDALLVLAGRVATPWTRPRARPAVGPLPGGGGGFADPEPEPEPDDSVEVAA